MRELLERLRGHGNLASMSEAAMVQSVVLPILGKLGWDVFNVDEVWPEYGVESLRVDFALRLSKTNRVFLEAKRPSEDLEDHQEQLLVYSFREGVKLSILTNGLSWWFYLPLQEGSWEQRKFFTIDIEDQSLAEIEEKFTALLLRDNVLSGVALEEAEAILGSQKKTAIMATALPKAWSRLLTNPEDGLIELVAETTEKLCGFRPDNPTVEEFLSQTTGRTGPPVRAEERTRTSGDSPKSLSPPKERFTGTKPTSFTLGDWKFEIGAWIEIPYKLCEKFLKDHESLEPVLSLRGRKRPYFTRNKDELRKPDKLPGTDIYLETNLSANQLMKISRELVSLFGFAADDLRVEYENKVEYEERVK